ncbi:hypothetical protein STEG23_033937, partial [Scotinomys teguina]
HRYLERVLSFQDKIKRILFSASPTYTLCLATGQSAFYVSTNHGNTFSIQSDVTHQQPAHLTETENKTTRRTHNVSIKMMRDDLSIHHFTDLGTMWTLIVLTTVTNRIHTFLTINTKKHLRSHIETTPIVKAS